MQTETADKVSIEEHKQRYVDEICQFVQIDSCSDLEGGNEGNIQKMMAQKMEDCGARVRIFEPKDIPEFFSHPLCHGPNRNYVDRPTVVGEIGPQDAEALLVMAHSDTKPIGDFSQWTVEPLGGIIRDNKIYGRGAADDKWGLAAMLAAMRALQRSSRHLKKRIIFMSTIDEESGVGNGLLLAMLAGIKAQAAFYLDGYQMKALIGSCGGSNVYLRPKGKIDNSVMQKHAVQLHHLCEKLSNERRSLFERPFFSDSVIKSESFVLRPRIDDHKPLLQIDFFTLPGEDSKAVSTKLEILLHEVLAKEIDMYDIAFRKPWFEPYLLSSDMPFVKCLSDSILGATGMPAKISSISKQDSFVLVNHAKIPVVAFGPMMIEHGIGAPHNPDECLDIDEAWQGCQVAYSTICRWLQYHDKQKVAKSQIIALERSSKTSGDFTKVSLLKN